MRPFTAALLLVAFVANGVAQEQRPSRITKVVPNQRHIDSLRRASILRKDADDLILLNRDLGRAESMLRQAMELDGPDYTIPQTLAELYASQGRLDEARIVFRTVVVVPTGRRSSAARTPSLLMRYVQLCQATGRSEEAATFLRRIAGTDLGEKFVSAAIDADRSGSYEMAVQYWTEAVRLRPNDPASVSKLDAAKRTFAIVHPAALAEARNRLSRKTS